MSEKYFFSHCFLDQDKGQRIFDISLVSHSGQSSKRLTSPKEYQRFQEEKVKLPVPLGSVGSSHLYISLVKNVLLDKRSVVNYMTPHFAFNCYNSGIQKEYVCIIILKRIFEELLGYYLMEGSPKVLVCTTKDIATACYLLLVEIPIILIQFSQLCLKLNFYFYLFLLYSHPLASIFGSSLP